MSEHLKFSESSSSDNTLISDRLQYEKNRIDSLIDRLLKQDTPAVPPEEAEGTFTLDSLNRKGSDVMSDINTLSGKIDWSNPPTETLVTAFDIAERRQALRRDLQFITCSRQQFIESALGIAFRRGKLLDKKINGVK